MQKIIRATEEQIARWQSAAEAVGLSWEEWARQQLNSAVDRPIVRQKYGFIGKAANGAEVEIRRYGEAQNSVRSAKCTQAQLEAFSEAGQLIHRNGLGDRERAIAALVNAGFDLVEVPGYEFS